MSEQKISERQRKHRTSLVPAARACFWSMNPYDIWHDVAEILNVNRTFRLEEVDYILMCPSYARAPKPHDRFIFTHNNIRFMCGVDMVTRYNKKYDHPFRVFIEVADITHGKGKHKLLHFKGTGFDDFEQALDFIANEVEKYLPEHAYETYISLEDRK